MDWSGVVIAVVSAVGGGGTVGAIYTAKKSSEVGQYANEIEATKLDYDLLTSHSTELRELWENERKRNTEQAKYFQEQLNAINQKLDTTRSRISHLEQREVRATRYIEKLKQHIWEGRPPPPPEPDHDLDYISPPDQL